MALSSAALKTKLQAEYKDTPLTLLQLHRLASEINLEVSPEYMSSDKERDAKAAGHTFYNTVSTQLSMLYNLNTSMAALQYGSAVSALAAACFFGIAELKYDDVIPYNSDIFFIACLVAAMGVVITLAAFWSVAQQRANTNEALDKTEATLKVDFTNALPKGDDNDKIATAVSETLFSQYVTPNRKLTRFYDVTEENEFKGSDPTVKGSVISAKL